jgi:tetratricopeptide (TPR) repeat protein
MTSEVPIAPRRVQRFDVIGHLGTGGMGSVFRARDPQLERDVALKLLAHTISIPKQLSENETLDLRTDAPASADDLLREARMMARLSHPNVLPVYEVGLFDDAVFVVMEHIDGADLRAWLAETRTNAQIIDVFTQAARGLAAAHASDIVHRDFKPENVLVGRDGRVRVADFGLSRLTTRPQHAMRRLDDAGGTPRYMAPELWRGETATKQSDVYAFCVAFAEAFGAERGDKLDSALRDREVIEPLRAAIAAGLAEDPTTRPALETIVAAIEGRATVRLRTIVLGGGAAASAVAVAIAIMVAAPRSPSCDVDSGRAGRWNDARRSVLRGFLEPAQPTPASKRAVELIVATLDEAQLAIEKVGTATCVAARDGTLTDAEANMRRSCIARREFELASTIDLLFRARQTELLTDTLPRASIVSVESCAELVAPPIQHDRDAVIALFQRYTNTKTLLPTELRIAPLEALAHDAAAAGERELEARATFDFAHWQREADHLALADEAMQRAYRIAIDIHSLRLQASVLLQRSQSANYRGDSREAMSLAQLALDLAKKSQMPATLGNIYAEMSTAAVDRGDASGALELIEKGLEIVAKDGHRLPIVELNLRFKQYRALSQLEGRGDEALAVARENVAWTRSVLGEHSPNYSATLTMLASMLQARDDRSGALSAIQEALSVASEPAESSRTVTMHIIYADALEANGRFEQARQEYTKVLAFSDHNETVRRAVPDVTARLGVATCEAGRCDEGLSLIERAIELDLQFGPDRLTTAEYRFDLLEAQLELGKLDDAEHTFVTLERSFRAASDPHDQRVAILHGLYGARLAAARGKLRKAEMLVRAALATWDEIKGDELRRPELLSTLAEILIEQQRWVDARSALDQALATARVHSREDAIAALEIQLARTEAALGAEPTAIPRAKHAREVLERYPFSVRARREADVLLGAKPTKQRPR